MFSPLSPLLWIGLYYIATKQNMDVQKDLLGWLEEVTLFSPSTSKQQQQPHGFGDSLNVAFDDFIGNTGEVGSQKRNKGHVDDDYFELPDVSDILLENDWMDEKIDFSILDCNQDWLSPVNDIQPNIIPEVTTDLQFGSCMDDFFSSQHVVPPFDSKFPVKNETYILDQDIDSAFCEASTSSPEHVILVDPGLQLPSSPSGSSCSGSSYGTGEVLSSPSNYEPSSFDVIEEPCSSPIEYCVEIVTDDRSSSPLVQEVCEPVCTGRAVAGGKDMSLIRKSLKSSKQSRAPYHLKKESRYERKKVQNKEAAARYRTKRKEQDSVLLDEVAVLEAEQERLQEKHDKLKSEVTYLKSLMKEMFQARGILKKK